MAGYIAIISIFIVFIFFVVLKKKDRKLKELISENDYLHKIIDSANEGIYVTDVQRRFIMWNDASQRISGYSEEEIMGRHCFDNILDHTDENGRNLCNDCCPLVKSMENRKSYGPEIIYIKHKDGHRIPIEVMTAPVFDAQGNIMGGVEIFHDVTDRLEKERLLIEKKQLDAVISLAGAAAHELRQPLQAIINFVSLLKDEHIVSEAMRKYLDNISESCYRMNNIIKKMGTITNYKTKAYAVGLEILDIEKSSGKYEGSTNQ